MLRPYKEIRNERTGRTEVRPHTDRGGSYRLHRRM